MSNISNSNSDKNRINNKLTHIEVKFEKKPEGWSLSNVTSVFNPNAWFGTSGMSATNYQLKIDLHKGFNDFSQREITVYSKGDDTGDYIVDENDLKNLASEQKLTQNEELLIRKSIHKMLGDKTENSKIQYERTFLERMQHLKIPAKFLEKFIGNSQLMSVLSKLDECFFYDTVDYIFGNVEIEEKLSDDEIARRLNVFLNPIAVSLLKGAANKKLDYTLEDKPNSTDDLANKLVEIQSQNEAILPGKFQIRNKIQTAPEFKENLKFIDAKISDTDFMQTVFAGKFDRIKALESMCNNPDVFNSVMALLKGDQDIIIAIFDGTFDGKFVKDQALNKKLNELFIDMDYSITEIPMVKEAMDVTLPFVAKDEKFLREFQIRKDVFEVLIKNKVKLSKIAEMDTIVIDLAKPEIKSWNPMRIDELSIEKLQEQNQAIVALKDKDPAELKKELFAVIDNISKKGINYAAEYFRIALKKAIDDGIEKAENKALELSNLLALTKEEYFASFVLVNEITASFSIGYKEFAVEKVGKYSKQLGQDIRKLYEVGFYHGDEYTTKRQKTPDWGASNMHLKRFCEKYQVVSSREGRIDKEKAKQREKELEEMFKDSPDFRFENDASWGYEKSKYGTSNRLPTIMPNLTKRGKK